MRKAEKYYSSVFAISLFFLSLTMTGCENELNNNEDNLNNSIDGWEIIKSSYDFDINPRDIFFVNPNTGFVVGYNGEIYKTIDSGENWEKKNSGTTLHLHSVYFINEDVGFVSSVAMGGCLDADCDKGCAFGIWI